MHYAKSFVENSSLAENWIVFLFNAQGIPIQ